MTHWASQDALDPILVYEVCHHLVLFPLIPRGGRGLEGKLLSPWRLCTVSLGAIQKGTGLEGWGGPRI